MSPASFREQGTIESQGLEFHCNEAALQTQSLKGFASLSTFTLKRYWAFSWECIWSAFMLVSGSAIVPKFGKSAH